MARLWRTGVEVTVVLGYEVNIVEHCTAESKLRQSVRARLEVEEGRDDSDEDSLGTEDVGAGDT